MHALVEVAETEDGFRSRCECGWKSRLLRLDASARDSHQVHLTLTRIRPRNEPRVRNRQRDPNQHPVMVVMENELFDRLTDRAGTEHRSRAAVMRDALRCYLTQPPRKDVL